jgi:hypothetical protein
VEAMNTFAVSPAYTALLLRFPLWMKRWLLGLMLAGCVAAQEPKPVAAHPSFELLTHRMDVDVDGAPNAYGPVGMPALDNELDAHYLEKEDQPIVGYLLDEKGKPVVQGPNDPYPGYYISQTAYTDAANENERDVRSYVDACKINYVVRGDVAEKRGVQVGDFVAVYSKRKHKAVFGIVGDTGNPSGDEGSLHLLQDLGYPFKDGVSDSVTRAEIVVRFYPNSNPGHLFFFTQEELDKAAVGLGLSKNFGVSPTGRGGRLSRK